MKIGTNKLNRVETTTVMEQTITRTMASTNRNNNGGGKEQLFNQSGG